MMKIEFSGSTPEEVAATIKDFVKTQLKGTRGGKAGGDADSEGAQTGAAGTGNAPAPLQPPASGPQFPATGQQQFAPAGPQFPGAGQQQFAPAGAAPEVQALAQRIVARIDNVTAAPPVGAGQPVEAVLNWFRGQCGPEAANATMDQIKTVFLPKMALPGLENIAKLMNA